MKKNFDKWVFIFIFPGFLFCFAAFTVSAQTCTPAPNGLVSWWPADGNALDVRGGNNGSLVGNAGFAAGQVSQGFNFTNPGGSVEVADNANLNITGSFTAEAWIFPRSFPNVGPRIFDKDNLNANRWLLAVDNTGSLVAVITSAIGIGGQVSVVSPAGAIQLNQWSHVAMTYTRGTTDADSTLTVFINGTARASTNKLIPSQINTVPLRIGNDDGSSPGNPRNFDGLIDEPAVYSAALSPSDIQSIFNAGVVGKCRQAVPSPVGLVSWWTADGNALDARSRNAGTLGVAGFTAGKVGQGFTFNNGNGVTVPDSPTLDPQNFTIETWFTAQPQNFAQGSQDIVAKSGSAAAFGYELLITPDTFGPQDGGVLRFVVRGTGGVFGDLLDSGHRVVDGSFHHVAASYDGATMKIFLDGILTAQMPLAVTVNYGSNSLFVIGSREAGGFITQYSGVIDEVGFYERALSITEIGSIVAAGAAGKCKPTATVAPLGLTAWWAGDGNTSDISGNGFDGILQGSANFGVANVGQGFGLNGTTARVEIAGAPVFSPGLGSFAIDAWIKTVKNDADLQEVVCRYGPGGTMNITSSDVCMFVQDGRFNGEIRASSVGAAPQTLTSTAIVADGAFHHIAMQRDTAAGTMSIFVDGVEQTAALNAQSGGAISFTDDKPVVIGASVTFNSDAREQFFTGVIDEVDYFNRALTAAEVTSIVKAGIAGKLKTGVTPAGFSNARAGLADLGGNPGPNPFSPQVVNTSVGDATVTFASVTTAGLTHEIPLEPSVLPMLPPGFISAGLYYDVATSSIFTGSPGVCFNVPSVTSAFARLRIMHLEGGTWQDRTAPANTLPIICTTGLSTLSPFALAFAPPTAALVTVSGTVTTQDGSGVSKATLSLSDSSGNIRTVMTNPLGYYRFDGVAAGEQYILSVKSKQRQYANNPRLVTVDNTVTDEDFTSLP